MKIYITGVTGTLGRAFVGYLQNDHVITGVDRNEERVASISREYSHLDIRIGDFVDANLRGQDLLIHLGALKHVDLCELTPSACISNNVIKTYELFKNAQRNNVDILFMSTDKAVEPCSVYGYSKALMEHMALELGGAVARSGNILASNGSVLNIWEQAIKDGQPLKITHKDMHRYFITPENLAERIWTLYLAGEKMIIPPMDLDIYLIELADRVLQKHGKSIDTYPIVFTGLRPGEKLREKLR